MTKKKDIFDIQYHDEEERELIEGIENSNLDEWVSIDTPERREELAQAARNTLMLRERKAITLRIPKGVIGALKEKASAKGMPYQTYINSVLFEESQR